MWNISRTVGSKRMKLTQNILILMSKFRGPSILHAVLLLLQVTSAQIEKFDPIFDKKKTKLRITDI